VAKVGLERCDEVLKLLVDGQDGLDDGDGSLKAAADLSQSGGAGLGESAPRRAKGGISRGIQGEAPLAQVVAVVEVKCDRGQAARADPSGEVGVGEVAPEVRMKLSPLVEKVLKPKGGWDAGGGLECDHGVGADL